MGLRPGVESAMEGWGSSVGGRKDGLTGASSIAIRIGLHCGRRHGHWESRAGGAPRGRSVETARERRRGVEATSRRGYDYRRVSAHEGRRGAVTRARDRAEGRRPK